MHRISKASMLTLATALAVALILAQGPAPAFANPCPTGGLANRLTSNRVGATATIDGNAVVYTFVPFFSEGTSGVPGLIEYCIYSDTLPNSLVVNSTPPGAIGANGTPWVTSPDNGNNFSFIRPGGNPTNIPYDSTAHTMGRATWTGGVPANYNTIVLHINDPDECDRLYGGNPGTCFVRPGEQEEVPSVLVGKGANPAFKSTFKWEIDKVADQTSIKQLGGTATVNYVIAVSHDSGTLSDVQVTGTIVVGNAGTKDVTVTVTDAVDNGGSCTVANGQGVTVPAQSVIPLAYTCTYSQLPTPSTGTNTATATVVGGTTSQGSASFDFGTITGEPINECVTVTDTNRPAVPPLQVCSSDPSPKLIPYAVTVTVPGHGCQVYDNTATFTTNDTSTVGTATERVLACGPIQTGARTIGFWKQTNGQNLIKTYCQNPALANFLKGLGNDAGPFSDAPVNSCNDLATYVRGILDNATAVNMNNQLKAQMLASALDVWFSGPGWTSTTINGVKPPSTFLTQNFLGTFQMDTTAVCPAVGNTTGTATCSNNTPSTDAVTAGVVLDSPLSMQAILDYAASQPAFTGTAATSVWYSGDRTKQEILKNIFDQFNNELAFGLPAGAPGVLQP